MSGKVACFGATISLALLGAGVRCAAASDVDLLDHFWKNSGVVYESPGNVLRMDVDLTGDGHAEILLANSQKVGNSGFQEWFVYAWTAAGRYKLFGVLGFSYQLFMMQEDGPRLVVYSQEAGPMGSLVRYRITGGGFQEESTERNVAASARAADFAAWRQRVGLKVLSAGLSKLNGTSPPNWKDLLATEPPTGVPTLEGLLVVE